MSNITSKRQFKTYEDLLVDPEDAEHPNKRPKETEHRAFKRIIASAAAGANIDHAARSGRESRLRDILLDLEEEDVPSSSATPVSNCGHFPYLYNGCSFTPIEGRVVNVKSCSDKSKIESIKEIMEGFR